MERSTTKYNKTGYLILLAVMGLLFVMSGIRLFPDTVKVQVHYSDEKDVAVYLVKGSLEERDTPVWELFHGGNLVIPMKVSELEGFQSIQIKFRDRVPGEEIGIDSIWMALGNFCFYEGSVADLQTVEHVHVGIGKESGRLEDREEDPFILIGNPARMLQEKLGGILCRYILAWLMAYLFLAILLYRCRNYLMLWMEHGILALKQQWKELLLLPVCLLTGYGVGRLLCVCNDNWLHFKELQNCEIIVYTVLMGFVFWLIQKRVGSTGYAVWATLMVGVVLLLSVKGLTTFLTADEHTSLKEHAKLDEDILRHWLEQSGRLSYMLTGTFFHWFPYEWLEAETGLEYQQFGKLFHWAVGVLVFWKAIDLVQTRILNRDGKRASWQIAVHYICLAAGVFLLPSTTIALKNYNYDLLSLCFAVLGAVYALIAFQNRNGSDGWKAVFFSSLGLLEKITVVPILAASLVAIAFAAAENGKGKLSNMLARASAAAAGGIVLYTGIVFLNQHYVLEFLKQGKAPIQTLNHALYMAVNRVPVLGSVIFSLMGNGYLRWLLFMVLMAAASAVSAKILHILCMWYEQRKEQADALSRTVVCAGLGAFLLLGLLFAFLHVEYSDDKLIYLCYIIKNYLLTMPTLLTAFSVLLIVGRKRYDGPVSTLWCLLIATWVSLPTYLYLVRWNPTWLRYLNLFQGLYALLVTAAAMPVLYHLLQKRHVILGTVCLAGVFHVCETAGSMPAFTYFAPCWYGLTAIGLEPEEQEMCVYWGDNRAVLGQTILDYCEKNGMAEEPIQIYYGYVRGTWITQPPLVTVADEAWNEAYGDCSLTERDFYAIDVQSVWRGMVKDGWPEGVEPVITVRYRGYVLARIYQGSQLREYLV